MASKNDSWGIEIGANAIKAVNLARNGSTIELVDYEVLKFKDILTTPDLDIDQAIQINLDALLQKHDMRKSTVVASVPGHKAFARFASLPPVEPKKIPDIVRFEAVQQIPFPIDQVEWDYQVFQQEDSPDVKVGIFAISKDGVMTFLNNFRKLDLRVDVLTLSPLAVLNAFAFEYEEQDTAGTIFMDIGTEATDVIIVEDDDVWMRTVPIGGNHFTEALMRSFKLSYHKAEKLKKEAGTSKYARQIFQAMRPVFADLVQELQRSIGYYQSLNREANIERIVGVGSTFRLPGLQKFLKQQLQMPVNRPERFHGIEVEGKKEADFADNALNMATAYGLALQGLGLESVNANIMPSHILHARMWKAKEPWIAGAAAMFAAAAGVAGAMYFSSIGNFKAAAEGNKPLVRQVTTTAAKEKSLLDDMIREAKYPQEKIEFLRRTLDYRDLWPSIIEVIANSSRALNPQPALLEPNYDQQKDIPRQQRRRIYINSITSNYRPMAGANAAAASASATSSSPSSSGSSMPPRGSSGMSSTGSIDANTKYTAEQFWKQNTTGTKTLGPEIRLTITGTTPYAQAATLVEQFSNMLEKATKNADLPFTTVSTTMDNVAYVRSTTGQTDRRNRPGFGSPTTMGSEKIELLPSRPTEDEESAQRDQSFTVYWTIQLKQPDQSRQTLEAQQPQPGPQATRSESQR